MIKSYKYHATFSNLKYSCISLLRQKRWKVFVSIIIAVVAIFVGFFVAIKYNKSETLSSLQEISLDKFLSGFTGSSSAFFQRMFSLCINVLLLFLFSLNPFLIVFAEILFAYRGYLFGLNFCLIFIIYGIGGSLTVIIVILPCQICMLLVLILGYLILSQLKFNIKTLGRCQCNRGVYILLWTLVLILLNLVETILLFLLNGKVILVI